jgi:hypothetical protein
MTLAPAHDLVVVADAAPAAPRRTPAAVPLQPGRLAVAGSALALLSLVVVSFLVQVGPLSWVEHARSQRVAYADLRRDLAEATVPTGPLDLHGKPVAPGRALGYLSVPRLGLSREVFFEGTTSAVTAKGPGHRRSSRLPGQPGVSVLYGRASAYGGPFHDLGRLRRGDVISVTTGQGVSSYRVVGTRHAGDRFTPPAAGRGLLTLVGAEGHAFVPLRAVHVDAELVSSPFPAPAPVPASTSLSRAEDPMQGDSAAWATFFLAMQGLAVASLLLAWASRRHGGAQSWLVGAPVTVLLLVVASREALRLLPNVL